MNKEFIPYDLAKELVDLGFDEKCFDVYSDVKSRLWHMPRKRTPKILWQQAFRFFREKYGFENHIYHSEYYDSYSFYIKEKYYDFIGHKYTYKEAQQICLEKLIENVKQN